MQELTPKLSRRYLFLLVVISAIFVFVIVFSTRYPFASYLVRFEPNSTREMKRENGHDQWLENYKAFADIAEDFKNFYSYTRSIENKKEHEILKGTVLDRYIAVSSSIQRLMKLSESKRKQEMGKMANFTRQEIKRRQNPSHCHDSPLLVYNIGAESCGFGCVLHTIVASLLQSFLADRTFVLQSKGWGYAKEGWEYIFLPLTNCTSVVDASALPIIESPLYDNHSVKIVTADASHPRLQSPWAVPKEFEAKLKKLHGDPFAWWIAQFTSYVFQFQPKFQEQVNKQAESIGFSEFVVGVQIRWGDKLNREAVQFPVEEYMEFVENWYKTLEHQGQKVERVVYLATEDARAKDLIKKGFPQYKFIMAGTWTSKRIRNQRQRFKHDGLTSIAMDIHFLSRCSYLVCTLSSNVCRTAYELMLVKHADATTRFQSLDIRHRFKGYETRTWIAIMDHQPVAPQELTLKQGDEIVSFLKSPRLARKGFLEGKNQRTNQSGIFPLFKARQKVYPYNLPIFHGVWRNS